MVVVSYSGKEINAKLVYYGAGLSGKTTNLESIYEAVPDTSRGKMVSMKTQSDRTLFFDLLPLDLGEIMGFKTRFLLYTVPGQVFYNATRKLVLKGADAIVFVADSEVGKMEENKESLANLKANLAEYGLNLDAIPWVMQYNKRDLPNVYSLDELNAELNPGGKVPFFEAVATQGKGVFETFRGISHMLMEKVTRDLRRGPTTGVAKNPSATPAAPAANAGAASLFGGAAPPQAAAAADPASVAKSDEPARPFGQARPDTAAPNAPGREIEQEARSSAPGLGPQVDYGREIELPAHLSHGAVPSATPAAKSQEALPAAEKSADAVADTKPHGAVSAAKHAEATPAMKRAEHAPEMPRHEVAPVAKHSEPAPVTPAAEPVAAMSPAGAAPQASSPRPESATARPDPRHHEVSAPRPVQPSHQAPAAAARPEAPSNAAHDSAGAPSASADGHASATDAPSIGQAARGGHAPAAQDGGKEQIVVPVRIPKGSSREIVLRIVISAEDDVRA